MAINVKDAGNNIVTLQSTVVAGQHITSNNVVSSALPTGAATDATQASVLAALLAMATKIDSQPITIAADSVGLATQTTAASINTGVTNLLTELGLQAKLTDNQPVTIASGLAGLALDATLQNITTRLVYPLAGGGGTYVENATDMVDTTPVQLVAPSAGVTRIIHCVTVGNENLQFGSGSAAVGTWVQVLNSADSSVLRSFYAPNNSSKQYPVGLVSPIMAQTSSGISVKCSSNGAAVRVGLLYV